MIGTLLGKTIIRVEKLFRFNASSFPGEVILKLFPNYLKKIKYPELVIMVTGSTGKGSTVKLLTEILRNNEILSDNRTKNTNNVIKKSKKIFNSILNVGNLKNK